MIEESLNNAIKRIQKKKKMQEASGLAARMSAAYTKNKDLIKAKKGLKKPKKGGALATTKGSDIKKTGSSALTPVKDARAGITKPEPEAKDQTIDVKATEVGGDLAKRKSKVGSMSNSGKKTVDPKKNTSIVKVGKQNDNSKTYDKETLSQNRGRYRSTDKQDKEQGEKDKEEAKKKRSELAKKVRNTAKSAIGGAAAAYGKSSFNVKEGKTFVQFVDDAVILDEELSGDGILKGNLIMKGIETAAPYIRKGLGLGLNILRSTKKKDKDNIKGDNQNLPQYDLEKGDTPLRDVERVDVQDFAKQNDYLDKVSKDLARKQQKIDSGIKATRDNEGTLTYRRRISGGTYKNKNKSKSNKANELENKRRKDRGEGEINNTKLQ